VFHLLGLHGVADLGCLFGPGDVHAQEWCEFIDDVGNDLRFLEPSF
jgi:hypothetical protein